MGLYVETVFMFSLGRVMRWRKSQVYDVLHKTTVTFLIGFSAVCCGYMGYRAVRYFVGMNLSALCSVLCRSVCALPTAHCCLMP